MGNIYKYLCKGGIYMIYKKIENTEKIKEYLTNEKDLKTKEKLVALNTLSELKLDINETARILGITSRNIYNWIDNWNEKGYEGLKHGPYSPGRPPRLSAEQIEQLKNILKQNDQVYTTQVIANVIKEVFDVDYSLDEVRIIAREKLGMYFSKPYPHDYRQPKDAEEILYNSIKSTVEFLQSKSIEQDEMAIGLLDESSPQTTANTVRTWSFNKHNKIYKNTDKIKSNTIGFYALIGKSISMPLESSKIYDMEKFLPLLKETNADYKAIIVILDNFSTHKALREKAERLGIYFVYLPKYSPNLNPVEFIWKSIKRVLSLKFVKTKEQMINIIAHTFEVLSKKLSFARSWIDKFLTPIFSKIEYNMSH